VHETVNARSQQLRDTVRIGIVDQDLQPRFVRRVDDCSSDCGIELGCVGQGVVYDQVDAAFRQARDGRTSFIRATAGVSNGVAPPVAHRPTGTRNVRRAPPPPATSKCGPLCRHSMTRLDDLRRNDY
jgi:hypothetical protein